MVYAALSLKRLATLLLWPFGLIVVVTLLASGIPQDARAAFKIVESSLTWWGALMTLVFGFSGRWAPWRAIWWTFPILNKIVFPDLNGKWAGTTSSNWPVISDMLSAAEGGGGLERRSLPDIPLQEDQVTLTVKASLFTFRIAAKLDSTGSTSFSITERVTRDNRRDVQELHYIYQQDTPQPKATDEGTHPGAASLLIDTEAWTLAGPYWTRRSWRSGMNTAGIISVSRVHR